jgi:phage gp36-like protein
MPYIDQTDLEGLIPQTFLTASLNDSGETGGDADPWVALLVAVQGEIDGRLAVRYSVPFIAPLPAAVKAAARIAALFFAYKRRGIADASNPWLKDWAEWKLKLDSIAKGDIPLFAQAPSGVPQGAIVGEPSRSFSESGRLMV